MKNRSKWALKLSAALISAALLSIWGCKDDKPTKEDNPTATVTDADGNLYTTVIIGETEWMAENLKTTSYRDGSSIFFIDDDNYVWSSTNIGAYAWYDGSIALNDAFGALYNWYAVSSGRLCPTGWRVATDEDWAELVKHVDPGSKDSIIGIESSVAGGYLKAEGTNHWVSPNKGAFDMSGFNALPGGYRNHPGGYSSINKSALWWTSTMGWVNDTVPYPIYRQISFDEAKIQRLHGVDNMGLSVRCVRGMK